MKVSRCFLLAALVIGLALGSSGAFADELRETWINPAYQNVPPDKAPKSLKTVRDGETFYVSSYSGFKSTVLDKVRNRMVQFNVNVTGFSFSEAMNFPRQFNTEIESEDPYASYNIYSSAWNGSGSGTNVTISYGFTYWTTYTQEQYVSQRVSQILGGIITSGMNNEQKVKAVHDWVVKNVQYDTTLVRHSAYEALYSGTTVCQGYALLMFRMLRDLGITGRIVSGGNHAWNLIYLCGNYYHLDATWDDPVPDVPNRVLYNYYNKTDSYMRSDHTWTAANYPAAPIAYVEGVCSTSQTYTISGYITGTGISGVTMTFSSNGGTATTDTSGYYSKTVSSGWSGTVTPSKSGYTFTPVSKSYSNVTSNQTSQNYSASAITTSYTISGYITGTGISGVTMTFSSNGGTATTDTSGYYSKTVSSGWSGTVTPSKSGYTFTPVSKSYSNVTSNQTSQNYSASAITTSYTISGYITDINWAGVSGITLTFSNSGGTATTDTNGYYSKTVTSGWSGTVTPSKSGYTFTPVSKSYTNVTANQTSQDYDAWQAASYTISGYITGTGISGVTMTFSNNGGTATTDTSGYYSKTVISGWSGTVTPSKSGYTFTPVSKSYSNVTSNQTSQNYSASAITTSYTISGYITDINWAGVSGITLTFSNSGGTATTDTSGYYSKTVTSGWSGTVTPSKSGWTFTPVSKSYTNISANQTSQDYDAWQAASYTISGYITDAYWVGVSDITLTFSNSGGTATTDTNGYYSKTVTSGWSGTVTPSKSGWFFTPVSKSYTSVSANQTSQNFDAWVAAASYTISGYAYDSATYSYLSGVTLMLSTGGTATTDMYGYYSFTVSSGWSGTVTPYKSGYTFTPKSYSNVFSDISYENYASIPSVISYTISGYVSDSYSGISGVTLTFSNGIGTALTDNYGYYSKTVDAGWSGTVTPYKSGYTFTPVGKYYSSIAANQTNQNYTGTPDTPPSGIPGDLNADGNVDLADVMIALRILDGISVSNVNIGADVNGDGKIDHVEAIFVLQKVAVLR